MNHFEQAALLFYWEKNFFFAYNLFLEAIELDKNNSMLWYGLGDSLCAYSKQNDIDNLYPIGIACFYKSHELNPNNKMTNDMLERLNMSKILGDNQLTTVETITYEQVKKLKVQLPANKLIEYYQQIRSDENKIRLMIHLGEAKNSNYFSLIKYCIENENNQNVRFAAWKRLPNFQESEDLKPIYDFIIQNDKQRENEPYFSISAGEIETEWANNIYKKFEEQSKPSEILPSIEIQKSIILENSEIEDTFIVMYLTDIEHLKVWITDKKIEPITEKIHRLFGAEQINLFKENRILDEKGKITELGLIIVDEFLKRYEIIEKLINGQNSSTLTSTKTKKWWQFWN